MVSKGCAFGFVVIGYVGILAFVVSDLVSWHLGHPLTYWVTNLFMSGHQYSCSTAYKVFEIPGCPAVTWSWWLATISLLKASFATTTIRPCRVHSPVADRVSPFGFCQVDISVGRSNCACKRRSSRVDNSAIDRFDIVANS